MPQYYIVRIVGQDDGILYEETFFTKEAVEAMFKADGLESPFEEESIE